MLAHDLMRRTVVTIHPKATLVEAAKQMLEHGVNALPVVDERGRLVGMVGIRDVLRVPIPSYSETPILRWSRLEEKATALSRTTVEAVMARRVVTVDWEATAIEVAALMANRGVHPIPVLRDDRMVGVVGRADVARALLGLASHQGVDGSKGAVERDRDNPCIGAD